jgi:DMSO reductase anchor subunit
VTDPGPDPAQHDVPEPSTTAFQARRLVQILAAALLAISVSALQNLVNGHPLEVLLMLASAGPLLFALRYARQQRVRPATLLMVVTLSVLLTILMAVDKGVHDPALLAYPTILVFAGMLGGRRLFIGLLGYMFATLAIMVGAELGGWYKPNLPITTPGSASRPGAP